MIQILVTSRGVPSTASNPAASNQFWHFSIINDDAQSFLTLAGPFFIRGAARFRCSPRMAFVQSLHRSVICPSSDLRQKPSYLHQRLFVTKVFSRQRNLGIRVPLFSMGAFEECKNDQPKKPRQKVEITAMASSSVNAETSKVDENEEKSEVYSSNMSNAMGAVLTYRHELGMNYNFILPDFIVGSCLQSPEDVDKLREIGVGTIFCLQKDSDLEYFGVDITAIQEHAKDYDDLQHIRAEIRDFDPFDLRMRLSTVVAKLDMAIRNGSGITYVHCTAGLGRAPAVALAYMYWLRGYKLSEANKLLQSVRICCPNLEAIKRATADMLTNGGKQEITLNWSKKPCTTVEVSGLDFGWDQRMPLAYDETQECWVLHRNLPVGRYEYKYVVDGNWTHNTNELLTEPNGDGHVNNYIEVGDNHLDPMSKKTIQRVMYEDVDLTEREREIIRQKLESLL